MNKMTECKYCKCSPVCKHKEQWIKYCEEHISLRKESVLFDGEPICRYHIEDISIKFGNDNEFSDELRELGDAEKILSNINQEGIKTLKNINNKPKNDFEQSKDKFMHEPLKEPKYGIRNAEFEDGRKSIQCKELTKDKKEEPLVQYVDYDNSTDDDIHSLINKLIRQGLI